MITGRLTDQPGSPLPRTIEPLKMVEQRVDLQGVISLARFDRLAEVLLDTEGDAQVDLTFDVDQQGIKYMAGSVQADVRQECQRCLQSTQQHISSEARWGLVFSEEAAKQLPRDYEPLILDGQEADLWAIVEDELMLSLPIVAYHSPDECRSTGRYTSGEELKVEPTENPFAVLANLKESD